MTSNDAPWKVLPHRRLEQLEPNLATLTGDLKMPLTMLERRMTVVRLRDGRLVLHSPIAVDDATLDELSALGEPAFLVVPNGYHRLDAPAYRRRFPKLTVVAPSGARAKVDEVVKVDTSAPDFGDDAVRFVEVPGTKGESALEVEHDGKISLILTDIVGNLPPSAGLLLRAMGFATREPRIPRAAAMTFVRDKEALAAQLDAWSDRPLTRLLMAHGRPVEHDVPGTMRRLAASLVGRRASDA